MTTMLYRIIWYICENLSRGPISQNRTYRIIASIKISRLPRKRPGRDETREVRQYLRFVQQTLFHPSSDRMLCLRRGIKKTWYLFNRRRDGTRQFSDDQNKNQLLSAIILCVFVYVYILIHLFLQIFTAKAIVRVS